MNLKTLYSKLAFILLGLFFLLGGGVIFLTLYSTEVYQQEVSQKLNRDVARNIAADKQLFMADHSINRPALAELFHDLMVINPSIEIYLLNEKGGILAFSAEDGKVKRKRVDLAPILVCLDGTSSTHHFGDDPRDPHGSKVFSAARIPEKGPLAGYLYIILRGTQFDSAVQKLQGSYVLKLTLWMICAGMLFAFLAGLLLFAQLTGRLKQLALRMDSFRRKQKLQAADPAATRQKPLEGDEIDRLTMVFSQMAQRIENQVEELTKSDTLRRELVANVSHDLRTPIATLQGYIETLLIKEKELSSEERRRYLNIAINHCKRLSKLVADLFELARLDSQEAKVVPEPFSLAELLQDVIQKFQLTADKKKISLEWDGVESLPFVHADIGLIERVLENLIENGLRHTPEGGSICFILTPAGNDISIKIRDTGSGIPQEALPFIFNRSFRVSPSEIQTPGHAGLGLAITKRILELHGSSIEVESQVNQGTTFAFQLPVYSQS